MALCMALPLVPQNNDFSSYIYILYYQLNVHYYFTPNLASFPNI